MFTKYGVVRNGEHLKPFDDYNDAEEYIRRCKDADLDFVKEGWLTKEQAEQAVYRIEQIKAMDETVGAGNECPSCDENRIDCLVWINDDQVACATCEKVYKP